MTSVQRQICEEIEALVNADEGIRTAQNVAVFCEDKGDPTKKIKANDRTKIRVLIATNGHARKPGTGASTSGDASVEITVFENPGGRKDDGSSPTVTGVAERIVSAVHWKTVLGKYRLRYLDMTRADADETDYRMIVNVAVELPLDPSKAVRWGIGESTFLGEITQRRAARAGVAVFEPDRKGDDRFFGCRNKHWKVSVTCTVRQGITEEDLPNIGDTFSIGTRSYYTETAELAESGEDSATVTLTGRTIPSSNQPQNEE